MKLNTRQLIKPQMKVVFTARQISIIIQCILIAFTISKPNIQQFAKMIYQILLYLFDIFSIETKQLDAFKTNTRFNIHLQPLAP